MCANVFAIKELPVLRAMKGAFLHRKDEIEKIIYSVHTDMRTSTADAAEVESVYSTHYKGMLDMVAGTEKLIGITILEPSERKLDWQRLTLAGHMASSKAVANG